MRLLNVNTLEFAEFRDETRPKYAIASHRWIEGCEVTLQELRGGQSTDKSGYKKIVDFANYVKEHVTSVEWLWVDTCCINKDSAAELSEAINLMFKWYRNAEICIAYLADVDVVEDQQSSLEQSFQKSEWFERGWTLQELLAPRFVVFVTKRWEFIGTKGVSSIKYDQVPAGYGLEREIAARTGIPEQVLHDYNKSQRLTVDVRLEWMTGRKTTRSEDMSYALYGIFGVTPGANYGEEHEGAQKRLLGAIQHDKVLAGQKAKQYREITEWLQPPDPWINHMSARQRHEPQTGTWLLDCDKYQNWKSASLRHLWLSGKAGCGKTVLCSTAVEDIRKYCEGAANVVYAVFYLSFSDTRKQSYEDILLSWVVQLGWREPALSMLQQVYDKPNKNKPRQDELETILLACANTYDKVFLLIDALDECPEDDDVRHYATESMVRLSSAAQQVRFLITSRELPDIRDAMVELKADSISIETRSVDLDIRRYMSTQLSRDHRLSRLDSTLKVLIEDTISQKADGMFRWAFCQMQELKKLKSTRPSFIKEALYSLPLTLDETYERMLNSIDKRLRSDACKLLRWITYAASPPSLGELVEVAIIDLATGGNIEIDDRPRLDDTLEILSGLIIVMRDMEERDTTDDSEDTSESGLESMNNETELELMSHQQKVSKNTKVRLAHFSVKEYLESERIRRGSAKDFSFKSSDEHSKLCQSCIAYITYYSRNAKKLSARLDLKTFPLLKYAASSWFYHSALQETTTSAHELGLLCDKGILRDWLDMYQSTSEAAYDVEPGQKWKEEIGTSQDVWSSLYYASAVGLERVVRELLIAGADVNAKGGYFGSALLAALRTITCNSCENVVEMLVNAGADVNIWYGQDSNALQSAAYSGNMRLVQILIDAGADINAPAGQMDGHALTAAIDSDNERVVQLLIDAGADVNAQHSVARANGLYLASEGGCDKVVQMLITAGANVNAQGGWYGNALLVASLHGYVKVVQILIDAGADLQLQGGRDYHDALQAASYEGRNETVEKLIARGADVNAQGGKYGNALQAASYGARTETVKILIAAGADVNAQGGEYGNALQAASYGARKGPVKKLIARGADVNAQGGEYGNELQAALYWARKETVQILIAAGADVNAQGGEYGNALQAASYRARKETVQTLIAAGADVNAQGGKFGNALAAALYRGSKKTVQVLIAAGADVTARGRSSGNALLAAAIAKPGVENEDLVRILIRAGLHVNVQEGFFGDALQTASYRGRAEMAQMLLADGEDVYAKGGLWASALRAAYFRGQPFIVAILTASGAVLDENDRDQLGRSFLHIMACESNCKAMEFVPWQDFDVNMPDNHGWTPLHWAAYFGNTSFSKVLQQHGVDHKRYDSQGWTPYHVATFAGHDTEMCGLPVLEPGQYCEAVVRGESCERFCHSCHHIILGVLHHCITCPLTPGYDLCFRCFRDRAKLHSDHEFTSDFRYADYFEPATSYRDD